MDSQKRHLWEYRWFTDLAIMIAVAGTLWVLYIVRGIILPVIFGLALAYAAEPVVAWAKRRLHIPRLATALLILLMGLVALTGVGLYVVPKLVSQVSELVGNVPRYFQSAQENLHISVSVDDLMDWVRGEESIEDAVTVDDGSDARSGDEPASDQSQESAGSTGSVEGRGGVGNADDPDGRGGMDARDGGDGTVDSAAADAGTVDAGPNGAAEGSKPASSSKSKRSALPQTLAQLDWAAIGGVLTNSLGLGWGFLSSAISIGTYLVLAVAITAICYVYFSWNFQGFIGWFRQFIPVDHRERTLDILAKMDSAISAWLRGRLIQVSFITVLLTAGWGAVGVPYWLVLGLVAGLANLVPYLSVIGWPAAVFLAWADSLGSSREFSFMWVIVAPSAVYIIGQLIDGWVMEPLVQGKATNLDPITVLLAVLIGGSLAGILGMLLAVPVAACGKILAQELLLPRIRKWAGTTDRQT